jgi:hypothetical protein
MRFTRSTAFVIVEMIGTGVPYHFNSSWGPVLSGK